MGKRQNPLPVWGFVHPAWHGIAKDAAGSVGAKAFPRNDKHASMPNAMRAGEECLQGAMGLILGATMQVDLGLDWDLTAAQFGQRSLVKACGNTMCQLRISRG